MPDREKVMGWLEGLAEPDWRECYSDSEVQETARQALDLIDEMLKEQETTNTGGARIFKCEKCGYGFDDIFLCDEHNYEIEPKFCPNCGRSVKWE